MEHAQLAVFIGKLITAIEKRIPEYMKNPADASISAGGNVAVCIIDADGCIYGKLYGSDKPKQRGFFRLAWVKASQVHLTGIATGADEKLVYNFRWIQRISRDERFGDCEESHRRYSLIKSRGSNPKF